MILLPSHRLSVIKPSHPMRVAIGEPYGGEIPMRLMHSRKMCSRLSRVGDNIGY